MTSGTISDIFINGIPAKKVEHISCLGGSCEDILLTNSSTIIDFSFENNDVDYGDKDLLNLLSTFKFTN